MSRLLPVLGGAGLACRPGCGACCIAPSIAKVPGMMGGKPANMACIHLRSDYGCALFNRPERPGCCRGLSPSHEMCGESREDALRWLADLEVSTRPQ